MDEALVGAVVQNLISISMDELNLIRGFKKEVATLKDSLIMIQAYLSDAEVQSLNNRTVRRWLQQLEDVAFEADAVLDEINYHLLRLKVKNKKKEGGSISCFLRYKIAHKIKDINKKLDTINKMAKSYDLQTTVVVAQHISLLKSILPSDRETDSFSLDPVVVGREDDISKIVEMLVSSPTHDDFHIVPIVGMGGLGKTTLARKVFNDEKINVHFAKKIWVYVSEPFNVVTLFKMIVQSLTEEKCEESREGLLKKIRQELGSKRYLLVLDDIWSDEYEKWEDFISSLRGVSYAKRNAIIVTTRKETVATMVKTHSIYYLSHLPENYCWSIIKAKAFKGADVPTEFEEIGKDIAQKCKGLPLAAKLVGGWLNGSSREEWMSILETRLSYSGRDDNSIVKILRLSFDRLPSMSLKKCFAYCSIFPRNYEIKRERVIELWMAEGFLQTDQGNEMEAMGNVIFNHLLHSSLFQDAERDELGNITQCKMHDLVHELACSISGMKNSDLSDMHRVRYLSLNSGRDELSSISQQQAKYLRTLFFNGIGTYSMILNFKYLHALHLEGDDIKWLPIQIGNLIHLRFLDISCQAIASLPDSICKLYNLQTLFIIFVKKLPKTITNLISLRHLYVSCIDLPPGIGKLTCLQTLPYYKVGLKKGCGIGELGSLKNLSKRLCIYNLENVSNKEEAKKADLFGKVNIFDLRFAWDKSSGEANDEDVLEGLQPSKNIKRLVIYGYRGKRFPLWTMKMAVHNAIEGNWIELSNFIDIKLANCNQCEEVPTLGHLPHLKYLTLWGFSNVKSIGRRFYGVDQSCRSTSNGTVGNLHETLTPFPALERLELRAMPNLTEWVDVEGAIADFPCLEYLKIYDCGKLNSVPSHFSCLKTLVIGAMESCLPLTIICDATLYSLEDITVMGMSELIYLPDGLFVKNQKLTSLSIRRCPKLTHIVRGSLGGGASLKYVGIWQCRNLEELPNDIHRLQSLIWLYILDCPKLKSIPYQSDGQSQGGLTSLEILTFEGCKRLTTLPIKMLESCAERLEDFALRGLPNFTNLPEVLTCLPNMTHLRKLEIVNIPKLSNFHSLSNLRSLKIGRYPDLLDLDAFNDKLRGIFQVLQSLQTLALLGHDHWKFLPDQLQYLVALEELKLESFGLIESLPEWLGNLSSLRALSIQNCKMLAHLPSKEAIQRLIKLKDLTIVSCPLLKERCGQKQINRRGNSEWSKISHIPNVQIRLTEDLGVDFTS